MMTYEEEMDYAQKATEAFRSKLRLLWGLLRVLKEHGWEESADPTDFLNKVFEKAEQQPENKDWLQREEEAQVALIEARETAGEIVQKLHAVRGDKIMHYGAQFPLNETQDLLQALNTRIKLIYDLRRGL